MSLAEELLRQVDQWASAYPGTRIVGIRVSVGELAGVEAVLFQGAFEILAKESSSACDATLTLEQTPVDARCDSCGTTFRPMRPASRELRGPGDRIDFHCPGCGGVSVTTLRGESLVLESITLEDSWPAR